MKQEFKQYLNYTWFANYVTDLINRRIAEAGNIDISKSKWKLVEHSNNYSKTSGFGIIAETSLETLIRM